MKRVIKINNVYGMDDKYVLLDEYAGFGIYGKKTPNGFFVHQDWLISDNKNAELVIESYNRLCKEEVLDIIDSYSEHLPSLDLGDSVLEDECKRTCDQIGNHNTRQKPPLESMGDPLVPLLPGNPFMTQKGHDHDSRAHRCSISQNHRNRRTLDEFKRIGRVVHIG